MGDLLARVADFFDGLQAREKLFVVIGAVAAMLILTVQLLLPMWDNYDQLTEQKNSLESDFNWLQEQRDSVVRLANNCPLFREQTGTDKSILTQLVRRNQLQVKAVNETSKGMSIAITGSESNRFLQLAHQIACRGFTVNSIAINPVENNMAVLEATMEVRRAN